MAHFWTVKLTVTTYSGDSLSESLRENKQKIEYQKLYHEFVGSVKYKCDGKRLLYASAVINISCDNESDLTKMAWHEGRIWTPSIGSKIRKELTPWCMELFGIVHWKYARGPRRSTNLCGLKISLRLLTSNRDQMTRQKTQVLIPSKWHKTNHKITNVFFHTKEILSYHSKEIARRI